MLLKLYSYPPSKSLQWVISHPHINMVPKDVRRVIGLINAMICTYTEFNQNAQICLLIIFVKYQYSVMEPYPQ